MATIIVGAYMVRYPLGGMMSWVFQHLVGFKALGHEVYFVEQFGYENSCYNPVDRTMSNAVPQALNVVKHGTWIKACEHSLHTILCFGLASREFSAIDRIQSLKSTPKDNEL